MDEKEKLVRLLEEGHEAFYKNFDPSASYAEALADHLLANGVTIQDWKPACEPPKEG